MVRTRGPSWRSTLQLVPRTVWKMHHANRAIIRRGRRCGYIYMHAYMRSEPLTSYVGLCWRPYDTLAVFSVPRRTLPGPKTRGRARVVANVLCFARSMRSPGLPCYRTCRMHAPFTLLPNKTSRRLFPTKKGVTFSSSVLFTSLERHGGLGHPCAATTRYSALLWLYFRAILYLRIAVIVAATSVVFYREP